MSDVTQILTALDQGQARADELLPLVYEELRKLAASRMAQESSGQTLQPTALVHEAWLRLVGDANPSITVIQLEYGRQLTGSNFVLNDRLDLRKTRFDRATRFYSQIAIGDRTVVSLEHYRTCRFFIIPMGSSSRAGQIDIFVNNFSIVDDLNKLGVGNFLPIRIEPRRAKSNIEALPFAGRLGCVHPG